MITATEVASGGRAFGARSLTEAQSFPPTSNRKIDIDVGHHKLALGDCKSEGQKIMALNHVKRVFLFGGRGICFESPYIVSFTRVLATLRLIPE